MVLICYYNINNLIRSIDEVKYKPYSDLGEKIIKVRANNNNKNNNVSLKSSIPMSSIYNLKATYILTSSCVVFVCDLNVIQFTYLCYIFIYILTMVCHN